MNAPQPFNQSREKANCDRLSISLRAFVASTPGQSRKERVGKKSRSVSPSEFTLVFDTETTIDASQRLRFGSYQLRKGDRLDESGLFYGVFAFFSG
jgi:hypothetical protein